MKRKVLIISLLVLIIVVFMPFSAEAAICTRDDGTWLFPLASSYYNNFTDWAGCPSPSVVASKCPVCGGKHPSSWGTAGRTEDYGHNGLDIGASTGTTVMAAAPGVAYYISGTNSGRGNTVIIEHKIGNTGYSYYSYYQHLSKGNISSGASVSAGQKIGEVGNTGSSSGAHLHFGIVMGKSGNANISYISTCESKGWQLSGGNVVGRILNNPASANDAGFPTTSAYNGAVIAPLKAHYGSVHYTFNTSKVSVGASGSTAPDINNNYNPEGYVDIVESTAKGKIRVVGWGFDCDTVYEPIKVDVYIGGPCNDPNAERHTIVANKLREDIHKARSCGNYHGFEEVISTNKKGIQSVYFYALDLTPGGVNPVIGVKTVNVVHDCSYAYASKTEPTCEKAGSTNYKCKYCTKTRKDPIACLGHDTVIDPAKQPTDKETGLSEGCHCKRCGKIIKEQVIIPMISGGTTTVDNNAGNNGSVTANTTSSSAESNNTLPSTKKVKRWVIKNNQIQAIDENGKAINYTGVAVYDGDNVLLVKGSLYRKTLIYQDASGKWRYFQNGINYKKGDFFVYQFGKLWRITNGELNMTPGFVKYNGRLVFSYKGSAVTFYTGWIRYAGYKCYLQKGVLKKYTR